jgi:hypothetical protein
MGSLERLDGVEVTTTSRALEQGFAFVPGCVDPDLARGLGDEVRAICRRRGWMPPEMAGFGYDSPDFLELQREVHQLDALDTLRRSPGIRYALRDVLGDECLDRQGDVCRVVFPQAAPPFVTRAHQDQFFLRRPDDVWAVWVPLGDCPRTMGPLVVWPGSHLRGLLPHQGEAGCESSCDEADWAEFDLACGDALLVHKLTVHRALPNVSQAIRVSIDLRFSALCRQRLSEDSSSAEP